MCTKINKISDSTIIHPLLLYGFTSLWTISYALLNNYTYLCRR